MKCNIDATGLSCPQPVVLTKNKMKECDEIEITVDNETARENIKRLAENSGWSFNAAASGSNYIITLTGENVQTSSAASDFIPSCAGEKTVIAFSSDKMGKGDDGLGSILMKAFINTITTLDSIPSALVFYNSGVLLAAEGSGVTDDLQSLNEKGVKLLICGTCVNYFEIKDNIKTGTISNMFDILNTMNNASKVINP
jgi:selenium metabolism protein YedF